MDQISTTQALDDLISGLNKLRKEAATRSEDAETMLAKVDELIDKSWGFMLAGPVPANPVGTKKTGAVKCPHCGNAIKIRIGK